MRRTTDLTRPPARQRSALLLAILIVALLLRLIFVIGLEHDAPYRDTGGDARWYLGNGYALFNGLDNTVLPDFGGIGDYPVALATLPTAPLYLLFVGFWQTLLPPDSAVLVIRLLQVLMAVALCYLVYRTTRIVTQRPAAGLLAAAVIAVHPAFVLETGQIATETLFIFLIASALWIYTEWTAAQNSIWYLALAALLLALATLTRAVSILFPVGLALHLVLTMRPRKSPWRRTFAQIALLLLVYATLASTWTIYNLARYNRLVIGAEGFASFLLYGALGNFDENRGTVEEIGGSADNTQEALVEEFAETVSSNPGGWLQRRLRELGGAYLQPHGTLFYSGESLRELVGRWWDEDRSLPGLLALTSADNFWPKFALYVLHFTALIGGLLGMILTRKYWWLTVPLIGWIAYITLLHFFLTALPRYLFPMEPYWWIFASAALITLGDRVRGKARGPEAAL